MIDGVVVCDNAADDDSVVDAVDCDGVATGDSVVDAVDFAESDSCELSISECGDDKFENRLSSLSSV